MAQALLFIPDISGYTQFINQTEISHQQHIIAELLEILLDTNDIGLELAEVEGDALFMYKAHLIPEPEAILSLVRRMFIRFHSHLRYYDQNRICHCGACEGATGLNLKFVIHQGEISYLRLKDLKPKPQGREVILAHRLLKNDINSTEYVLLSHAMAQVSEKHIQSIIDAEVVQSGQHQYGNEDIGMVSYHYADLGHLKNQVEAPEALRPAYINPNPLIVEEMIDKEPVDLFEILINFEHRVQWNPGVEKITYDEKEINKSGSKHICIIEGKEIEFETLQGPKEPGIWSFGEKSRAPIIGEVYVYFMIYPDGNRSKLKIEVHPHPSSRWVNILLPLFKIKYRSILKEILSNLKSYAESI